MVWERVRTISTDPLFRVVALGILVHVAVLLLAWMIGEQFPIREPDNPGLWTEGAEGVRNLARWDSAFYLEIVERGYEGANWAFFPGYPALVWLLSATSPLDPITAGVLISIASGILFLVGLYVLTRTLFSDESHAWRTVIFAALAPGAVFLSAVYAESLFMALTVWGIVFITRRKWVCAGALIGIAAIVRPVGLLLIGVYALYVLKTFIKREDRLHATLGSILTLLPTVGFMVYNVLRTGDPLYTHFVRATYWDHLVYLKSPFTFLSYSYHGGPHQLLISLVTVLVIAAGVYALWHLSKEGWSLATPLYLYTIALAILYTMYADIIGMPRYALTLIPGFWMLSHTSSKPYAFWTLVGTSVILAMFALSLFVNWWYLY